MATQNKPLGWLDGGLLTLAFDYDDVLLRILTFHAVNTGTHGYTISATSTSTGKQYIIPVNAGQTIDQAVTPGTQNRLDLTVTTGGKLDGVEWSAV